MSLADVIDEKAAAPSLPRLPGWLLGWALAALLLLVTGGPAALRHELLDPDNALRLVQVRDLLAGQPWFDPVQYRLNPPEGVPMHWARVIDGVLALQIGALTPLLGSHAAETAVAVIWPLGLLVLLMLVVARIGRALGESFAQGPAVAFVAPLVLALSFPAIEKFGPGFFDHHNVVMLLLALAMLAVVRLERGVAWGGVAGAAIGVAVGVAAEAVPLAAAALVIAGLRWVAAPVATGLALAAMGAATAISTLLMLGLQSPPSLWFAPVCDAISASFAGAGLAAACVAGGLYWVGVRFPALGWIGRLGAAGVLGSLAGGALIVLFPECSGGGYGSMSDTLASLWLPQVSEARSLFEVATGDLTLLLASAGAPLAALAMIAATRRTPALWTVAAFLAAAVCVMVWQVRGATFATLFAAPVCALMIVLLRERWRAGGSILGFAGMLLIATPAAWAAAGSWVERAASPQAVSALGEARADARACSTADALAQLSNAPAGVILNEFSLGAAILQHTGHSVLAAPYHRNEAGLTATVESFRSAADAPPAALPAGVDYVLVCPGLPESAFYASHAADGVRAEDTLASRLSRGEAPGWLAPVEAVGGPLRLYRVVR